MENQNDNAFSIFLSIIMVKLVSTPLDISNCVHCQPIMKYVLRSQCFGLLKK